LTGPIGGPEAARRGPPKLGVATHTQRGRKKKDDRLTDFKRASEHSDRGTKPAVLAPTSTYAPSSSTSYTVPITRSPMRRSTALCSIIFSTLSWRSSSFSAPVSELNSA
jgi:hypothetical protein